MTPASVKTRLLKAAPPTLSGLFLALVSLGLWQRLEDNEVAHIRQTLKIEGESLQNGIIARTDARIQALVRMAKHWDHATRAKLGSDVEVFKSHYSDCQAIEWVDPNVGIRWILNPKQQADAQELKLILEKQRMLALESIKEGKGELVSRAIRLPQNDRGLLVYVPQFSRGRLKGLLLAVFRVQALFDNILVDGIRRGFSVRIYDETGPIYEKHNEAPATRWKQTLAIVRYGIHWRVELVPATRMIDKERSTVPRLILMFSLALSALIAFMVSLGQTALGKARAANAAERALRAVNEGLEQRVAERTRETREANESLQKELHERLKAEAELQSKAKELERSNDELQQFAYVASHNLKEPLRMVTSYLQLLERRYQGKLDERADEFIRYAVEGSKRMHSLIDALLLYSRVGTREVAMETVRASDVVKLATDNLKVAIRESSAEVSWGDLPEVEGDEILLTQLFQNLIANAIKFRGDSLPRIRVEASYSEERWKFSVTDNGIGIDPQFYDRVFVIFQRLHNRTQYPGTGIGLAVCKKIIERHHGRIWVESEPGKGSTFFFTLQGKEPAAQGASPSPGDDFAFDQAA